MDDDSKHEPVVLKDCRCTTAPSSSLASIAKNVSNADGALRFEFADDDLIIFRDVWLQSLGSACSIEFVSASLEPSSFAIDSLHVVIESLAVTSNIRVDVPMQVWRNNESAGAKLHMFVSGTLEISAPNSWLRLHGDSLCGARLNLESSRLVLSSSIFVCANVDAGSVAETDTIWQRIDRDPRLVDESLVAICPV